MLGVVRLQVQIVFVAFFSAVGVVVSHTACVTEHYAGRSVESVFEAVTNLPKIGQPHPTSLDGAGPRHAVAFALLSHP